MRTASAALDATNVAILRQLTAQPGLAIRELVRRVDMSAPAVNERVQRLREAGVIRREWLEVDLPDARQYHQLADRFFAGAAPQPAPAGIAMSTKSILVALALLLAACGGGSGDDQRGGATTGPPPTGANISLLFMGNSHTSGNDLTGMVADMVRTGKPGETVASVEAPGWMFLEERVHDGPSLALLRSQDWSFVILQAQKYSSSGQFTYSTAEAQELVRVSRAQHAVPAMFPEWPRKDIDETQRIFDLHVSIAQAEPACVAPIPQSFDLALARDPTLALHASDGNHSAPAGAFLAALVLYATITGLSPLDLPALPQYPVSASVQQTLRGIAAETVQTVPPRMWCPGDAF